MNAGSAIALAATGLAWSTLNNPSNEPDRSSPMRKSSASRHRFGPPKSPSANSVTQSRPGMTESDLWSIMFQSVIDQNGDYCETRLLNSGRRIQPLVP